MKIAVEIYKKILNGELKKFPNRFWVDPGAEQNAREITKYFIEEILKWSKEDIKKNLCEAIFRKYKLSGMLEYTFGRSPFKAIDNAYPDEFKEWEFKTVPKHLWEKKEKRESALKWLLLKVNKDKFEELTNLDFIQNGLGGLLDYFFRYKEFNNVDIEKVENGLISRERTLDVIFNKSSKTSSRNSLTARIKLPISWVNEFGLTEENCQVVAKFQNNKIIIEPKNN